jgi:predicted helicase
MGTLAELLDRLSPDPRVRGHQFEPVAKWFLLNDPVQKAQFRKVWLWSEWPDADGPDIGIDLVAETRDRSLVAVQVKCHSVEYQVPKREIDSFLSASSQGGFSEDEDAPAARLG